MRSEEGLLHLWLELWGEFCHPKVTFCMFSAQFLTVPYCLSLGNGRQKRQCHDKRLLPFWRSSEIQKLKRQAKYPPFSALWISISHTTDFLTSYMSVLSSWAKTLLVKESHLKSWLFLWP